MIHYDKMCQHIIDNATVGGGPIFCLDHFLVDEDRDTRTLVSNLCVDVDEDGMYTLYEYKSLYSDYVDDTCEQSLEEMLRSVIDEIIEHGVID